jgi:hypothetical protein
MVDISSLTGAQDPRDASMVSSRIRAEAFILSEWFVWRELGRVDLLKSCNREMTATQFLWLVFMGFSKALP